MRIVPIVDAHADAFGALFDACGCACFCRYWHFDGTKNDWLTRCSQEPTKNRDEHTDLLRRGDPQSQGLLAFEGDTAIGWVKVAPRATLRKLVRQGAYRPLDLGPDAGVWSIGCLLVRADHRRRGVARRLVQAAPEHVRTLGGTVVEAYPRRVDRPLHDEEAWMGTAALFLSCGFSEIAGDGPYPVMRRAVETGQPRTRPDDSTRPSRTS